MQSSKIKPRIFLNERQSSKIKSRKSWKLSNRENYVPRKFVRIWYRNLLYYEGIRAKTCHEYKLHKNSTKITQTGPSLLHAVVLNVGWFAIQWRVQPYKVHMIAVQLNMVNRAWIPEVWRKPVAILRRFIPSKFLLLQWLFNLPLVAQWINFWLIYRLPVLGYYTSPFLYKTN